MSEREPSFTEQETLLGVGMAIQYLLDVMSRLKDNCGISDEDFIKSMSGKVRETDSDFFRPVLEKYEIPVDRGRAIGRFFVTYTIQEIAVRVLHKRAIHPWLE